MRHLMGWVLVSAAVLSAQSRDLQGVWKADAKVGGNLEAGGVIVEPASGKIPYTAEMRSKTTANFSQRLTADPDRRCFQPGVPRAALMGSPFQILQNDRAVYMIYERVHSYRILYLTGAPHNDGLPYAMGDSRAHWEGNTLVVDAASFSDKTWLDAAGHSHSEGLHVVERYTRSGPDTIAYEATLEDPGAFTMPWKIKTTLRRQAGAELQEDECDVDDNGARHHVSPYRAGGKKD